MDKNLLHKLEVIGLASIIGLSGKNLDSFLQSKNENLIQTFEVSAKIAPKVVVKYYKGSKKMSSKTKTSYYNNKKIQTIIKINYNKNGEIISQTKQDFSSDGFIKLQVKNTAYAKYARLGEKAKYQASKTETINYNRQGVMIKASSIKYVTKQVVDLNKIRYTLSVTKYVNGKLLKGASITNDSYDSNKFLVKHENYLYENSTKYLRTAQTYNEKGKLIADVNNTPTTTKKVVYDDNGYLLSTTSTDRNNVKTVLTYFKYMNRVNKKTIIEKDKTTEYSYSLNGILFIKNIITSDGYDKTNYSDVTGIRETQTIVVNKISQTNNTFDNTGTKIVSSIENNYKNNQVITSYFMSNGYTYSISIVDNNNNTTTNIYYLNNVPACRYIINNTSQAVLNYGKYISNTKQWQNIAGTDYDKIYSQVVDTVH